MSRNIERVEEHFRPTFKLRLAALQMLIEWLILGDVLSTDPLLGFRRRKHFRLRGREAQTVGRDSSTSKLVDRS